MDRIYENYEKNYLNILFEDLLPTLVEMKKINNVIIPTISIDTINDLGLSNEEKEIILQYLRDNEILITNDTSNDNVCQIDFDSLEDDIENYKKYRLYKKATLPNLLKKRK